MPSRTAGINVEDGMLVLRIENEEFTRGGSGSVRFTLENTGEAEIEITTATNNGASSSNQIIFYLLDADGNVLSTKAFHQALGTGLVTLSNGNTVARIEANETFASDVTGMTIPAMSAAFQK